MKTFKIHYHNTCEINIEVDENLFNEQVACEVLLCNNEEYTDDPIKRAVQLYAFEIINIIIRQNKEIDDIIEYINDYPRLTKIDGSAGITLIDIEEFNMDIDDIDVKEIN